LKPQAWQDVRTAMFPHDSLILLIASVRWWHVASPWLPRGGATFGGGFSIGSWLHQRSRL